MFGGELLGLVSWLYGQAIGQLPAAQLPIHPCDNDYTSHARGFVRRRTDDTERAEYR